ncbi:cytochrome C [Bacillus benzoevorans]|uniref:Cytochrome c2 n=1 Tax=Bacillus benzoevorans TaxID=1456 RepID=A0A7X0LW25_9BACI|nr:cytochrome C [Bacillus benzoevorans]MBB6446636.1 cytochrome c2 [Bacillus benzoevorans]
MGKNIIIFLICFIVAFGAGYFIIDAIQGPEKNETAQSAETTESAERTDLAVKEGAIAQQQGDASNNEGRIFLQRGCVSCHSVSALNIQGGATGPDLSQAYVNVEGKHGVPLEEFLKKPTSAVMSSVLGGDPLTDDERAAVIAALKAASEK